MKTTPALHWVLFLCLSFPQAGQAAGPARGDAALSNYFRIETARLSTNCLSEIGSLEDWDLRKSEYRRQLFEMLSLWPVPERTELHPVVTGVVEQPDFKVEKLHFQSRPGLYVTANLYLPKALPRPLPAILYLTGHGPVITNGVSYGNKVTYQHHGVWFARNGYACLVLDSLQLGEILGLHHGTHREKMWWWNSRGYTPAGVEAWNCIRALDYLATRPEVDMARVGATGRSGGGAYSWWIAALDDRIKAAAPVAGITDLRNHVVDGVVEGHCDCMFTVNTYRWDYAQVAALVAPRPLLIVNTDADSIFPLDGVQRLHAQVRRIYGLHQAADKLGLAIGPGPHKDTQDLQVPVFRWFNRHLKGEDPLIEMAATKLFTPAQLKVFTTLPADSINTNIQETFVAMADPAAALKTRDEWQGRRGRWLAGLKETVFRAWPEQAPPLRLERTLAVSRDGRKLQTFDFDSQDGVRLRLYWITPEGAPRPRNVICHVAGEQDWPELLQRLRDTFAVPFEEEWPPSGQAVAPNGGALAREIATQFDPLGEGKPSLVLLAPRGLGVSAWTGDARKQTHIRRRFMLLGQTLDAMRVWDTRRACLAMRELPELSSAAVTLAGRGPAAVNALYASLFERDIAGLHLIEPSESHRIGPDYLNVLRVVDVPHAAAMAAERRPLLVTTTNPDAWGFAKEIAALMQWPAGRLRVEPMAR